jgi:hypothetical protein
MWPFCRMMFGEDGSIAGDKRIKTVLDANSYACWRHGKRGMLGDNLNCVHANNTLCR